MPTISVTLPDHVADALNRQAAALLLGRRAYIRALLAAIAAHADEPAGALPAPATSPQAVAEPEPAHV